MTRYKQKQQQRRWWGLLNAFNPGTKTSHSRVTVTGKSGEKRLFVVRSPHATKVIAKRRAKNKAAKQARKRNRA